MSCTEAGIGLVRPRPARLHRERPPAAAAGHARLQPQPRTRDGAAQHLRRRGRRRVGRDRVPRRRRLGAPGRGRRRAVGARPRASRRSPVASRTKDELDEPLAAWTRARDRFDGGRVAAGGRRARVGGARRPRTASSTTPARQRVGALARRRTTPRWATCGSTACPSTSRRPTGRSSAGAPVPRRAQRRRVPRACSGSPTTRSTALRDEDGDLTVPRRRRPLDRPARRRARERRTRRSRASCSATSAPTSSWSSRRAATRAARVRAVRRRRAGPRAQPLVVALQHVASAASCSTSTERRRREHVPRPRRRRPTSCSRASRRVGSPRSASTTPSSAPSTPAADLGVGHAVRPRRHPSRTSPPPTSPLLAGGGPVWSCGYDDHTLPPVRGGGNQALPHRRASFACIGALTAVLHRDVTGVGQLVDVSMHAAANVTTESGHLRVARRRQHGAAPDRPPRAVVPTMPAAHAVGRRPLRRTPASRRGAQEEFEKLRRLARRPRPARRVPRRRCSSSSAIERGGASASPTSATTPRPPRSSAPGATALVFIAAHLTAYEFFVGAQQTRAWLCGAVYVARGGVHERALRRPRLPRRGRARGPRPRRHLPGRAVPDARVAVADPRRAPHVGEHQSEVFGKS